MAPDKMYPYDQVVYLLQGGGALGSYQVGVCQGLMESDIHPDWVVGTSIGAINAAIIAGNAPKDRIAKLKQFWEMLSQPYAYLPVLSDSFTTRELTNLYASTMIALNGVPGFFKPRYIYPWSIHATTPDNISFYDTAELRKSLLDFVDFDLINKKKIRLTLGVVRVKTGELMRFDNLHDTIAPEHIMASAALPPGFPAIKIDNEYYWDGGVNSNTPFSVILEEKIPQTLLCIIVNLFSYMKRLPDSMLAVMKARKEIENASRHNEVIKFYCEIHNLQRFIQSLSKSFAESNKLKNALDLIKHYGHPTAMNIARFHYRDLPSDLLSKDYNFSHLAINEHYQVGYQDAKNALKNTEWLAFNHKQNDVEIHEF